MTIINALSAPSGTSEPQQETRSAFGKEFNNFIKLLTAQVRFQDPLSPLDGTQFVEQLATFSSLEQQVNSNEALKGIATMMNNLNSLMASEWLGQAVNFETSWRPFTGSPAEFSYIPPPGATTSRLSIRDSTGTEVWNEILDPTRMDFSWNGQMLDNRFAKENDMFEFLIDSYAGPSHLGTEAPFVLARITELTGSGQELKFGTDAGLSVDFASVRRR